MTTVMDAKKTLKGQVKKYGQEAIEKTDDSNQKRIIGTMSTRMEDSLDILDYVEESTETIVEEKKRSMTDVIHNVLLHPSLTIILLVCVITFSAIAINASLAHLPANSDAVSHSSNRIWIILSFTGLGVIFIQSLISLVVKVKGNGLQKERLITTVGINMKGAERLILEQSGKFTTDSKAISAFFQSQTDSGKKAYEKNLVKLYCKLYETKVSNPSLKDINSSLQLCRSMMWDIGLDELAYSDDAASYFDISLEDYHDEMRFPAIVRSDTREIVKRGKYIRNSTEN